MKVLHVIDSLGVGGGAEHSLAAMLPLLDERDVESSLAVLIPRVGGLQQELNDRGYPLEVLGGRSWPGRVRALRRLIRTTKPDLVHVTLFYSSVTARLANAGMPVPLLNSRVSTSYDPARTTYNATSEWKLRVVRAIDRMTARSLTDHFHAVTPAVAEETTSVLGVPLDRITVIPRGRSVEALGTYSEPRRSETRRRLSLDPETPVLLHVGRQDHAKDHVTLVRAFARVNEAYPDSVLLLAGREGDASVRLNHELARLDLGDSVRLLGHRTDVADLYVAADLFLFPSLYEGAAGSLLEAMALEVPIVGSNAVADVLDDGRLGEVAAVGDVSGLAAAVVRLLDSPSRRRSLAEAALTEFTDRYRINAVADQTVQLYTGLISASRQGRRAGNALGRKS